MFKRRVAQAVQLGKVSRSVLQKFRISRHYVLRQSNAFAAVDRRRSVDGNFLDVHGRVADKHSHKHVARVVVHILGRADLLHEAFVHDDDSVRRSNLFYTQTDQNCR
mgnify:CR=1 FL=1